MSKSIPDSLWKQCAILHDLDVAEQMAVVPLMQFESFERGTPILDEGLTYAGLWIVIEGRCEVIKSNSGSNGSGKPGEGNRLAVLEPGGVFGDMSFFNTHPHSASVRALTGVDVARLTRENYDGLRDDSPTAAYKIAFNLVNLMAERLRKMDDWLCGKVEAEGGEKTFTDWREFRSKLYSEWSF